MVFLSGIFHTGAFVIFGGNRFIRISSQYPASCAHLHIEESAANSLLIVVGFTPSLIRCRLYASTNAGVMDWN